MQCVLVLIVIHCVFYFCAVAWGNLTSVLILLIKNEVGTYRELLTDILGNYLETLNRRVAERLTHESSKQKTTTKT